MGRHITDTFHDSIHPRVSDSRPVRGYTAGAVDGARVPRRDPEGVDPEPDFAVLDAASQGALGYGAFDRSQRAARAERSVAPGKQALPVLGRFRRKLLELMRS